MGTDKREILSEIKNYYNFNNDIQFANFLNISTQTLSQWEKENYFDLEVVYSKIRGINLYWLITGEGNIAIDESYTKLIRTINEDSDSEKTPNTLIRKQHKVVKYQLEEIMDLT